MKHPKNHSYHFFEYKDINCNWKETKVTLFLDTNCVYIYREREGERGDKIN